MSRFICLDDENKIMDIIKGKLLMIDEILKQDDGEGNTSVYEMQAEDFDAIKGLLDLYNKEKDKYKRLSIEAQATAFNDVNKDTETLLRVLLKQNQITLDENGYYQRQDFDWEENLMLMGLMKKREKTFYIPDEECLDEYTKQLESQLKEYNEIKEIFKKYYVMDNETMYDGCIKMQDEIDELKEKNEELEANNYECNNIINDYIDTVKKKDKIIDKLLNEIAKEGTPTEFEYRKQKILEIVTKEVGEQ